MIKAIVAEDFYKNKVYIIREKHGWEFYNSRMMSCSLSNFSSNAAELYIALNNLGEFDDVINVIKKHADYLLPESIKYHS